MLLKTYIFNEFSAALLSFFVEFNNYLIGYLAHFIAFAKSPLGVSPNQNWEQFKHFGIKDLFEC